MVNIYPQVGPTLSLSHISCTAACITLWVSYTIRLIILTSPHPYTHFDQLYEYACMFTFEVRFIWAAPWNFAKCLYLLTRYLQFLVLGALIYQSTAAIPSSHLSKNPTQPVQLGQ